MFGLGMAVATVYAVPSKVEPAFWLAIFLVCATVIAKRAPGRYFLHGLCVSLVNCVWITSAHILLFDAYAVSHADEVAMAGRMGVPPRAAMAIMGPVVGVVSGLVLGLFSVIASKIVKPAVKAA